MALKTHIKQAAKSKTVEFNVVIAPAIVGLLSAFGISVPLPVIIGAYAVCNYILRKLTKKPLNEK